MKRTPPPLILKWARYTYGSHTFYMAATSRALVHVELHDDLNRFLSILGRYNPDTITHDEDTLAPYFAQYDQYFGGQRQEFSFAIEMHGTPFQRAVWRALQDIPYGTTRTYGDIARAIGRPTAFRAVGQANHHNPLSIVVPCHRVIGQGGHLTGYGGGVDLKAELLNLELSVVSQGGGPPSAREAL